MDMEWSGRPTGGALAEGNRGAAIAAGLCTLTGRIMAASVVGKYGLNDERVMVYDISRIGREWAPGRVGVGAM